MGGRIGTRRRPGIAVLLMCGSASSRDDLADPVSLAPTALHRHADRCAGVPGDAEEPWPAIILAFMPHLAAWGKLQITTRSVRRARTPRQSSRQAAQTGVLPRLEVLGGARSRWLVLGRIACHHRRELVKAAAFRCRCAAHISLHARRSTRHRAEPVGRGSYLAFGACSRCAKFATASKGSGTRRADAAAGRRLTVCIVTWARARSVRERTSRSARRNHELP